MNIYLIEQSANRGYDTYDSAVVIAENEEQAVSMHPYDGLNWDGEDETYGCWTNKKNVTATLIGQASEDETEPRVVLGSFNAG